MTLPILHQGDHVIVVDKPAGLLVHNSAWAGPPETTVTDLVRAAGFVDAVPLHRLDRQTSGCLAFARAASHVAALQTAWGASPKHYLALVRGHVRAVVDVDHPLDDDDVPGSPRKDARSRIAPVLVSDVERCSLVCVTLSTGRRHQARRHCKHASHPILGDATHGKGPLNRDYRVRFGLVRMALHAWQLTQGDAVVTAPVPADWSGPLALLFPGVAIDQALASIVRTASA